MIYSYISINYFDINSEFSIIDLIINYFEILK